MIPLIVFMPRQISIAMSGEQRHILVRLWNEICVDRDTWQIEPVIIWILLLHQKISTSMLGKNNTFRSKHGMGGPRWMQNWISKFKCKIFPTIWVPCRKISRSVESIHRSRFDSSVPSKERLSRPQREGSDQCVHDPAKA